jgi:predicted nucleotidyltransferase
LGKLEESNGFNFLLAVETGSRGRNVNTDFSDFDVKGIFMFMNKDKEYDMKHFKNKKDKIKIDKQNFDIDYTFYNIDELLENRVPE